MRSATLVVMLGLFVASVSCNDGKRNSFKGSITESSSREDLQKEVDAQYQANPELMRKHFELYLDRSNAENYQLTIDRIENLISNKSLEFDGFVFSNLVDKLQEARDELDALGGETKTPRELYQDLGLNPYDRNRFSLHSPDVQETLERAEEFLNKGSSTFAYNSASSKAPYLGLNQGRAGVNCTAAGNAQDASAIAAGTCGMAAVATCPTAAFAVSAPACLGSTICMAAAGVTEIGASIASLIGDCNNNSNSGELEPETHACPQGETYDGGTQKCIIGV